MGRRHTQMYAQVRTTPLVCVRSLHGTVLATSRGAIVPNPAKHRYDHHVLTLLIAHFP